MTDIFRRFLIASQINNKNFVVCSLPITSEEELEAQKLVERGEIDQAIALCQRLKSANGRMFHLAGVLYAEKKGDPHSAIDSFQEALRIQEEVFN